MTTVQKDLETFLAVVDGEIEAPAPKVGPHGKVVDRRFEAFHDVTVYEDGYEDRFYIGD